MNLRSTLILFVLFFAHSSLGASLNIKDCLKQAFEKENPLYQVPEESGPQGFSRYLALICNEGPARDLYDSISGPTSEGDWNGRTRGTTKFLAESGGASMCYHITRNRDGETANEYSCSIRLNIDSKKLGTTSAGAMIPFPLK